ncbi:MAG: 3-keto-5-aminohexanoate cleavage protein, partial [Steroidobacteraceae bacterium]
MAGNKVIITCAITGAIHTPTLSDALPWKPADLASQALAAAKAGAAILHIHARNPADGSPTGDPKVYEQFLPQVHAGTDAVINLTTGGSPEMTPEERLAAAMHFSPEMCSLNMGSMNFSFHDMGRKVKQWKFPWENQYILNSEKFIFRNTFADIRRVYELMAEHGTRYEHECYDIGHLYNLAYFLDKGLAKPPLFIQSVFGILGGIGADPDNVVFMRRTADRLFGKDYVWS